MPLHHPPTLVVSKQDLVPLEAWQAALDATDFLVPLRLEALRFGSTVRSAAALDNRRLEFTCERRDIMEVVGSSTLGQTGWSFAYAFRGLGTLGTSAAANMLALAYAIATRGAFLRSGGGTSTAFAETKANLDLIIATVLDRGDLLAARYPHLDRDEPFGPGTVLSRLAV